MENKDKKYINAIIDEYNALLDSWGPSDSWNLNQFKTLENMIFETTKIDVNANTLKRFFQQKTGNPQLATKDALCRFLGYSSYTEFVMKKTGSLIAHRDSENNEELKDAVKDIGKPEKTESPVVKAAPQLTKPDTDEEEGDEEDDRPQQPSEQPSRKVRKRSKRQINLLMVLLLIVAGYLLYVFKLKDVYTDYLISKIEFTALNAKGICPLTVTFSYDIPSSLMDDITIAYEEANGDEYEKKLKGEKGRFNATYIYEGEALCHLKYKGRTVKTLPVECRKAGWSVYAREERKKFFQVFPIEQACNDVGYVTLPIDNVPKEAQTNHVFVSYVFYKENLVDGDNFIYEARVRNSKQDNAIPCADIIMYIYSDTGMHGIAMNEDGYSYMRFISGENSINGEEYDLSQLKFDSSQWHIIRIKVVNKKTSFYIDGEEVQKMDYNTPIGSANELTLRFKGCGAVDYVKVYNLKNEIVYEENFDSVK